MCEYLIRRVDDRLLEWYVLREGRFELLAPTEDGVYRSEVFPGLWLDPEAMLAPDGAAAMKTLGKGLGSTAHEDFVSRLANRKQQSS